MTDDADFEATLRHRLEDAAAPVTANEHVQRRFIQSARAAGPARLGGWVGRLSAPRWMLPSVAALTALVAAAAVLVVRETASGTSSAPAGPAAVGQSETPAVAPSTLAVVSTSAAPSATPSRTHTRTASTSAAPSITPSRAPSTPPSTSAAPKTTPAPRSTSVGPLPTTDLSVCGKPDGGAYEPTSEPDFVDHVLGTWLICSSPSIFNTQEAGMVISADGRWAKLYRDQTGHLYEGINSGEYGVWTVIDISDMNDRPLWQLNLRIAGSGTVIVVPEFAKAFPRIHLDNNGDYVADYIRTAEHIGS